MAWEALNRRIVVIVAAFVALMAVALLLANLMFVDIGGAGESIWPKIQSTVQLLTFIFMIVFIAFIVYLFVFLHGRSKVIGKSDRSDSGSPFIKILAYFIVAIIAILFIMIANPTSVLSPNQTPDGGPIIPPGDGSQTPGAGGQDIGPGIAVLIAVMAAAIILVLVLRRQSDRRITYTSAQANRRAQEVMEDAVRRIYLGEDVRSVIIRAYQQMEMLLPRGRFGDDRVLTPREFAQRAVSELRWPPSQVNELTALFEEARYSDHPVKDEQKERAVRCLEGIRRALGGEAPGRAAA
jgi:hypothetical protein